MVVIEALSTAELDEGRSKNHVEISLPRPKGTIQGHGQLLRGYQALLGCTLL